MDIKAILAGTPLEGAEILYIDGTKKLVRYDGSIKITQCKGDHYVDLVNNTRYHAQNRSYDSYDCSIPATRSVKRPKMESVTKYLSKEDIDNMANGSFDMLEFAKRIEGNSK